MNTYEYILEITEGKVQIPDWDTKKQKKMWLVCEYMSDGTKITKYVIMNAVDYDEFISDIKNADQDYVILDYGDFIVDDLNMWTIPKIIMDYLQGNVIYLYDSDTYISIYNEEDYKIHMEFVDKIMELLSGLQL